MSIVILGIVILFVFYKLVSVDSGDNEDYIDDFLAMKDAASITRGDNPLDPESQIKSMTDPMDVFGDK